MKLFLSMGEALRFYTSSNMAVKGNSAVDLLVIAFLQMGDIFYLCLDLLATS